jgi:muramoyltetrapeptide carboxypeptidase LdcA involved in peptidoglycan recycling
MIPPKLKRGDTLAVVAPSHSLALVDEEIRRIANSRFQDFGFHLTFGAHAEESDAFDSTTIEARVADLHAAFVDERVQGIITVLGGFNSNQLLDALDFELIKAHPKVLCGYSDITVLNAAIWAKCGLVTYSGPHYSTFGQKRFLEFTPDNWRRTLMQNEPFEIAPSAVWNDDNWEENQDERGAIANSGWQIIHEGEAQGTIIGTNASSLNLLQGTPYFPDLTDSILWIEDDEESKAWHFDRHLQGLIQQPSFAGVRALVIGRFQKNSEVTPELVRQIVESKPQLSHLPVIAGLDFGHTSPMLTLPIGGTARISAQKNGARVEILEH